MSGRQLVEKEAGPRRLPMMVSFACNSASGAGPPTGDNSGHAWADKGTTSVNIRQLFPLSELEVVTSGKQLGRRSQRREAVRSRFGSECNAAVRALNWYAKADRRQQKRLDPDDTVVDELQAGVRARVALAVESQPCPAATPSPQAAFRELLRGRAVYDLDGSTG